MAESLKAYCSSRAALRGLSLGLLLTALAVLPANCEQMPNNLPASLANGQSSAHQAVGMYNLGLAAYKAGSLDAAIVFFRRATDLDPNLTDAQYNLGVLYQNQKRNKEAIARFQEVLRIKASDPDAHYQLGVALMDMGRAGEAKSHFAFIAPTSSHFPDAQKRIQLCGEQLAAATMATPSYSFQTAATNPVNQNPAVYGVQDGSAAPFINTQPLSGEQNYLAGSGIQPNLANQQLAAQPNVAPGWNTAPQAQAPVPARPVVSGVPVAVLANASARVIATGFSAPSGLTFDRTGNLYVANFANNSIDRISPDGTKMQFSAGATLKGPIGLACDDSGNVYVANYTSNTVARISPAGVSTLIGTGFKKPYYLTLDKSGNLFVSQQEDNSIVKISLPKTQAYRAQ